MPPKNNIPSYKKINIGSKYNKLTTLKYLGSSKSGQHTMYECVCDCGNKVVVRGSGLLSNHVKSCGCQKIISATGRKTPYGYSSFRTLYSIYRTGAKRRGYEFELDIDVFESIVTMDCYYCGKPPSNKHYAQRANGEFLYNGIDRVDNNKGYTIDNIQPCCARCNIMKSNMGLGDFINHIKSIYKHLSLVDIARAIR